MTVDNKWQEVALVDLAYEVLNNSTQSMNYRDVFKQAADMKGLTDEELMELLPQVFTEMNLDGRFLCISPSEWGLKKWYTTQHIEESIEALARSKGIDDDDDYGFEDEEDSTDFSDDEDFDAVDGEEVDEDIDEVDEDIDEDIDEEDEDLGEEIAVDEEFEEETDLEEDEDLEDADENEKD